MSSVKTASEMLKLVTEGNGFDRFMRKVKIISADEGKCTAEMTVDEEHTNRGGTLHGGCTATLVDVITSIALATNKRPVVGVSVDMHISFLRAAPIGQQIVMEAKTNKIGRTLAFLDIVIKNKQSGAIVATGNHTKFVGS